MSNSIVVMKVGSSLISQGSRENSAFFKRLAKCIQKFRENDFDVVLVSSGAISYGMKKSCLLYTSPSPRDLTTSRMPSSA